MRHVIVLATNELEDLTEAATLGIALASGRGEWNDYDRLREVVDAMASAANNDDEFVGEFSAHEIASVAFRD